MIGIIAAMESEMSILREELHCEEIERIAGMRYYLGDADGKKIMLVQSGVGKVNSSMAATILIHHFGCCFILNTGIAGGLLGVHPKDIILASNLIYSDVDATGCGYQLGQGPGMPLCYMPNMQVIIQFKRILNRLGLAYKEGTIYTSDSFITTKDHLKVEPKGDVAIVEMEGAAIAQVCTRFGVDYMVIRYVSDIVDEPSQIEDYKKFEIAMAERSNKICLEIIRNME
ncbi:MAG: 5'-methylthioadenosine/adenosylhomocysteine nucleosidase [Anaeroplasmataceae bacterium]|nr:5'-methylthioadenosine/adenosylhomocysteine nucleosidase [Anaeroplasmataceae bacterium]